MAVTVARHLFGDDKLPARLLRRAQWHVLSANAITSHLTQQRQEVPRNFCAGGGIPTPLAVSVARHVIGDDEVPAWLLRRARRPILLAVAVA